MTVQDYYALVEACIRELGVDPVTCRGQKEGQWDLQKGSASVWIDVIQHENGWIYFQCMAPVCKIPTDTSKKIEFYEEILEKNHQLFGVGLTKYKEGIYIKTIREMENIDKSEILAQINRIGNYADDLDDYFNEKYK